MRLPFLFFFFNDTATTEIYTLSLHDALPISIFGRPCRRLAALRAFGHESRARNPQCRFSRSEEHTSELQSQSNLVCRLLLEKKKEKPAPRVRGPPHAGDLLAEAVRAPTAHCL